MIQSVLAAMFGVQSQDKRHQDFSNKHLFISFTLISIVFVFLLVLILIWLVSVIIS
ncbi:DUF2970 domain-containing protein [Pseudoalteromonas phenolica]|uniref:DUF2970 domain-containing protein n=1 Tax=Pseudoalteromonas phenolica TaxID=161398 RepID=A0A0S2K603_9GAMM|nr:DUF2970 domain-containing protein [Pseudoalteromonas phenolica]ALO43477.1 hypothetical protein PP2015_2994 [Pseudoalteromonas phenolica]MBE0355364.1 hypothetical protein [Pseudoalteromonas phenolica O-BC30]